MKNYKQLLILFVFSSGLLTSCEEVDRKQATFTLSIINPNTLNLMELSSNAFDSRIVFYYIELKGKVPKDGKVNLSFYEFENPDSVHAEANFTVEAGKTYEWDPYEHPLVKELRQATTKKNRLVGK